MRGIVRDQKVQRIKLKQAKAFRSAMTMEEEMLWRCLRRNQVGGYHFRRQHIILVL